MKKSFVFALISLCIVLCVAGCTRKGDKNAQSGVPAQGTITLSTTTSTQDSGLLDYLLPIFTAETGWSVDVIAVGTGAALQMGRDGQADALLVHAKDDEIKFVADGFGVKRYDVMYNDFVLVGPPQGAIAYNNNVEETFKAIAAGNLPFVSRGDRSGTHSRELAIWKSINIEPEKNTAYASVGQGMGATLRMANEMNAYTLSDRATWLTTKDSSLAIVCELSPDLLNYYGVIAVNPSIHPKINTVGGQAFIDWMLSERGQALIGEFGTAEFGSPLFTPNAGANQ